MPPDPADAIRALVIDERPDVRRGVLALLETAGVTAYDVGSPLGATSLASRLGVDVLILGDLSSTTGRRVAQLVRNSPRLMHLKVVLFVEELPSRLGRELAEVDAVLAAPNLGEELLPTLRRLLGRTGGSAPEDSHLPGPDSQTL